MILAQSGDLIRFLACLMVPYVRLSETHCNVLFDNKMSKHNVVALVMLWHYVVYWTLVLAASGNFWCLFKVEFGVLRLRLKSLDFFLFSFSFLLRGNPRKNLSRRYYTHLMPPLEMASTWMFSVVSDSEWKGSKQNH